MKTKLNKIVAALAMLYLAPTSMAHGEVLDGHTMRTYFETWFPDPAAGVSDTSTQDVVVGPEIEITNGNFPNTDNYVDIDFSDTNILITLAQELSCSSCLISLFFEDTFGTIPRFTSVALNPETTGPNIPNDISVRADLIIVHFLHGGVPGATISLDITVIPEPATAGLVLMGLIFIAGSRRGICSNRH